MSGSTTDSFSKGVSTVTIIAAVVSTVMGLSFCVGFIVILVCVIKKCNKSNNTIGNGVIMQPYPPAPNYMSGYPPNPNYMSGYPPNPNYAPDYPPTYTSTTPEFTKTRPV